MEKNRMSAVICASPSGGRPPPESASVRRRRFRSAVSRGVMPGPLDARDVGEALIAQQLAREWTDRRESWCGQ